MTLSKHLTNPVYKNGLFIILYSLILFSCVTQRSVEYMQDKNKTSLSFNEFALDDYRLKPNDELYIQISSLDDAAANIFSGTVQQTYSTGSIQPYGASLLSYSVDKDGLLFLPFIGSISVKDKTIPEVKVIIKESLTNILSQPVISVKLVNRYISILGEVRNPGHFAYAQEKLTIYDALSLAGDITDYGNRSEIILTRNENGKNTRINLDLTKSNILASEYYYIRPNDIVYVKPLNRKFWNLRQFPYSVILSTITTALLIYNVTQ